MSEEELEARSAFTDDEWNNMTLDFAADFLKGAYDNLKYRSASSLEVLRTDFVRAGQKCLNLTEGKGVDYKAVEKFKKLLNEMRADQLQAQTPSENFGPIDHQLKPHEFEALLNERADSISTDGTVSSL